MVRRGRAGRGRRRANTSIQLAQVVGLGLLLVMILLFRDKIAGSASLFLGAFDSPDITLSPDAGIEKETNAAALPDAGS